MQAFRLIGINPPDSQVKGLAARVALLLEQGVDLVHLRLPHAEEAAIVPVLEALAKKALLPRVALASHHALYRRYPTARVHLSTTARSSRTRLGGGVRVSTSTHSLEELVGLPRNEYDYAFLGPIYPSLSKEGYRAEWNFRELAERLGAIGTPAIALGGVTAERLPELKQMGFSGAASIGALWASGDSMATLEESAKRFVAYARG